MPWAPRTPCTHTGCPHLSPCPVHPVVAWRSSLARPRIRGRALKRLRKQLFSKQPLCVRCQAMIPPRVSLAVIRDHVSPLAEGGEDVESNVAAICRSCSDLKTAQESARGRARCR